MTLEQQQRIQLYYENEQYENISKTNNIDDLYIKTISVYNPLKDIVTSLVASSIKEFSINNEKIKEIWNYNNFNEFKYKICREMYLRENIYVEVIKDEIGNINYILHENGTFEFEENNGEIIYFKIIGVIKTFDEKNNTTELEFSREYKKIEGKVILIEKLGDIETENPFALNDIPVIKFSFKSNIYQALNIIDRINENESYIRKTFDIHGDPLLHADNTNLLAENTEEGKKEVGKIEANKRERRTIIETQSMSDREAKLKYIELSNPISDQMMRNNEALEARMKNMFPELTLVDGENSNISTETYSMKTHGLKSKIKKFRDSFINGIYKVDNIALKLVPTSAETKIEDYIYLDIFEEQEVKSKLENISIQLDIISKIEDLELQEEAKHLIEQSRTKAIEYIKKINE